jgi:hypothetical protein
MEKEKRKKKERNNKARIKNKLLHAMGVPCAAAACTSKE